MTLREALLRGRRRPHRFGAGSPTTYRGDGYEFVELRTYVPGDDVRRIDWAATARAGALQTRVVLEDVTLTLGVIVDDSASMQIGRSRPLLQSAREAAAAWFDAAMSGDRCLVVGNGAVVPKHGVVTAAFDLHEAMQTARAALARGAALLVVSDWYDLAEDDDLLMRLGARLDCTALIARDPWWDGLPLRGLVRIRGAEGGSVRCYIGRRERESFKRSVRDREARIVARLERAGWRTGILDEADGTSSLMQAFGLRSDALR